MNRNKMTEYNWKRLVDDDSNFVRYSFKRVGAVIAVAAILSGSNIEYHDGEHFKAISGAMEYLDGAYVESLNTHMDDETRDYIAANPKIKGLLDIIEQKIPMYFTSKDVWVELIQAPGEEQPTVSVNVASRLPLEKALEELSAFDEGWWSSYNVEDRELVNIDVITS